MYIYNGNHGREITSAKWLFLHRLTDCLKVPLTSWLPYPVENTWDIGALCGESVW